MGNEKILEIKNLTKKYGETMAVANVSLAIAPGEIFALIGPNGSGKTTLVKTVAGLLRPSGGEITVVGQNTELKPELAKHNVGYIPDEPAIWNGMSGNEFLHAVGALWGMAPKERTQRIQELLPNFDIAADQNEPFEEYSRGSKQKLTILAALLHQPKLLLVDEPIVGLDPTSAVTAKNIFQKFAEGGGAVLLVTHTLPVAEEIAHRIGLLKQGKLVAMGTLSELRTQAKLKPNATLEDVYLEMTQEPHLTSPKIRGGTYPT